MSLKTSESIAGELDKKEAELDELESLEQAFEQKSREERIAEWKSIVDRTQAVIGEVGVAKYRPYIDRYNAHTESHRVRLPEENSSQPSLTFNISHEQSPEIYDFDCAGVRWLTVVKEFQKPTEERVSVSGGNVSIGPRDCVEYPSNDLPEYVNALNQAEKILGLSQTES